MTIHNASFREALTLKHGLYGAAAGAPPAGTLHRADAIETVPGTDRTVDGQPISEIWNDLLARNAAFNVMGNRLMNLLTFDIDRANEQVAVPSNPGFQEATEFGRPTKIALQYVARGFPIKHYDLGYGFTQEFIDRARGREIVAVQSEVQWAYERLLYGKAMAALFDDTNATDQDGVAVKRLYNNDGEVPPRWQRWTHLGTHNHYIATGAAAFVTGDIAEMEEHLVHHGFTGQYILHAHRDDLWGASTISTFADFIPATSADRAVVTTGPIVGPTPVGLEGLPAVGYVGKFTIVENNEIPAGYLLAHVTGGALNPRNVLGFRAHENPSVRGLRLVEGPNGRYPLIDAVYDTYLGFGVGQRGAAVVAQATAGAYTVPTFT